MNRIGRDRTAACRWRISCQAPVELAGVVHDQGSARFIVSRSRQRPRPAGIRSYAMRKVKIAAAARPGLISGRTTMKERLERARTVDAGGLLEA